MKLVIGIVGEIGAGKETVKKLLMEEISRIGFTVTGGTFSSILSETLNLWGIPNTRRNLQRIAVIFRDEEWEGLTEDDRLAILTNAIRKKIEEKKEDVFIIDGVRWASDRGMIRRFPRNLLIYVTATRETRFKRTKARKEKSGEENISWEQFLENEMAPNETLIRTIAQTADITIGNEVSRQKLRKIIKAIVAAPKISKLLKS